ncbi:hypothetical protein FE697_011930 [Mumia zhuanghuii]|uniref:Uncharacterized protein n=2 Tax=Mumia TaxID=1546255 RepID=A0ABW1QGZ7_9ACTN|nr:MULTISPECIES: hypothetical protein [Mumia]KAA1422854.1 hypothetical protein FE697_011930 [Mumia zhuanghuii]
MSTTTIARQFNGPDHSGNGGYVAGLVAGPVAAGGGAVTSTLRVPPPLEVALDLSLDGSRSVLADGATVVAEAAPGAFDVDPAPFVGEDLARKGFEAYAGRVEHPFPHCFTCGTARAPGDGLLVFTGPVDDPTYPDTVAATWTPHAAFADTDGHLGSEVTWAAIDCPGGWAADIDETPMVLGRMTGEILSPVRADHEYVAVGTRRGVDGRKHHTGTALYALDGTLVARAEQTWIAIDISSFR